MIDIYPNIEVSETEPVIEPVSLEEAKAFAVIDYDDQDVLLTSILTASRQEIEEMLGWKVVPASVVVYVDTTKDSTLYHLPKTYNIGHIASLAVSGLEDGEADEVLTLDDDYYFNGSLKIGTGSFKLAYDLEPVVPEGVKEAIKMLFAYRANHRGDEADQNGFPADVEAKISRYRRIYV